MGDKDLRAKHLEFIEASIARMGQNSFQMKGWEIAVLAALTVLYIENDSWLSLAVLFVSISVFWCLDGYYLYQERRFRDLYDAVVRDMGRMGGEDVEVPLFSMKLLGEFRCSGWLGAVFSSTLSGMYVPLLLIVVFMFANHFGVAF